MIPVDPTYWVLTGYISANILQWAYEHQGCGLRYSLQCLRRWAWD